MQHNNFKVTPLPRICLISNGEADADQGKVLLAQLNLLPETLPCMVQIREKRLEARELFNLAERAGAIKLPAGSLLLCNDRLDIALAAGLDGVHLPENACPADKLRTFAPNLIFGCSIHSLEALHIAERSGADYLLFGPVFDTPSKRRYGASQGLHKLGEICMATSLPFYALGGIRPDNAGLCMDRGADGAAGLSVFQDTARLVETLEQFYSIICQ